MRYGGGLIRLWRVLVQQREHAIPRYPSDLTDAKWETIGPHFAVYQPLTADLREMVNACRYPHRTGCRWRYVAKEFGPRETVRT